MTHATIELSGNNNRPEHHLDALRRMQLVMGPVPDSTIRPEPTFRVLDEHHENGLIKRKVQFAVECDAQGEVTDWCPAWWLIPESATDGEPRAAVLCLHQTVRAGKDEPAGLTGNANLHYALELARLGFVCFAPDYPRFGEYAIDPYAMGYASATMKAIWNHSVAVDVLAASPEVDPHRIGCIGHSLGGHNSLFVAAFDSRISVAVSSCGFNQFTWNNDEGRGDTGDISDWSHDGYMPWIAQRFDNRAENMPFDFHDVLGAIAPRAIFVNAPEHDFMIADGVRETLRRVGELFEPSHLQVVHPDCKHDFPDDARQAAYEFLRQHLAEGP